MPLNPQIALQTQVPQMQSPMKTLGALAQLRDQEGLNQQRQLANEQKRRDLERDDNIKATIQRTGNPDTAIDDLYAQGDPEAAGLLSKSLFAHRQAQSEQMKRAADAHKEQANTVAQIAQTMKDQASYTMGRDAIMAIDKDAGQYLPPEHDPEVVKRIVGWGTSRAEQLKVDNDAIINGQKASEIQLAQAKDARERQDNVIKAREYWQTAASQTLGVTGNQDDWDRRQRLLVEHGAPADILAQFGNQWSPEAVAKAKALGMKPKESADVSHQKVEENQGQQNINLRGREVAVREEEAGTSGHGRTLTPNAESEAKRWKATQYQNLEKTLTEKDPDTGTLTRKPLDDSAKAEIGQRKLQIEDAYRDQIGQPPLVQAEHDLAGDPSKSKELRKVRNTYRQITGQDAPLERMEKVATQLKAEKDPAKANALRQQLTDLRAQFSSLVGR